MKSKKPDPFLLAVLSDINRTAQTPPKGFKTVKEWGKVWGYKPSRALEIINKGIQLGTAEKKIFRVLSCNNKRIVPTPHYGLKKKT